MVNLPVGYILHHTAPTPAQYQSLRLACLRTPRSLAQATPACTTGSVHFVHLTSSSSSSSSSTSNDIVGMGRIIGDRGWYYLISDLAVHPAHQHQGLAQIILHTLLAWLRATALPGSYITLVAKLPARNLVERLGFRPSAPETVAMAFKGVEGLPDGRRLMEGYEIVRGSPGIEDYRRLRELSGLSPKTVEQAAPALKPSKDGFFVHVVHSESGKAAAMGRIISDGGWYFLIADIATLPDHQKRGLGGAVMGELMGWLRERGALTEEGMYVGLGADRPGVKLYERWGFKDTEDTEKGYYYLL